MCAENRRSSVWSWSILSILSKCHRTLSNTSHSNRLQSKIFLIFVKYSVFERKPIVFFSYNHDSVCNLVSWGNWKPKRHKITCTTNHDHQKDIVSPLYISAYIGQYLKYQPESWSNNPGINNMAQTFPQRYLRLLSLFLNLLIVTKHSKFPFDVNSIFLLSCTYHLHLLDLL